MDKDILREILRENMDMKDIMDEKELKLDDILKKHKVIIDRINTLIDKNNGKQTTIKSILEINEDVDLTFKKISKQNKLYMQLKSILTLLRNDYIVIPDSYKKKIKKDIDNLGYEFSIYETDEGKYDRDLKRDRLIWIVAVIEDFPVELGRTALLCGINEINSSMTSLREIIAEESSKVENLVKFTEDYNKTKEDRDLKTRVLDTKVENFNKDMLIIVTLIITAVSVIGINVSFLPVLPNYKFIEVMQILALINISIFMIIGIIFHFASVVLYKKESIIKSKYVIIIMVLYIAINLYQFIKG